MRTSAAFAASLVCAAAQSQDSDRGDIPRLAAPAPAAPGNMGAGTGVQAEVAELQLPDTFIWTTTTVLLPGELTPESITIFRTRLDPEEARAVVLGALRSNGWKIEEPRALPGMVSTNPARLTPVQACRDDRPLTMATAAAPDGTRTLFYLYPREAAAMRCNAPARIVDGFEQLREQMPTLEPPADPATGMVPQARIHGGGSSPASTRTHVMFHHSGSLEQVTEHFVRQLGAQGWELDAQWRGESTAGSSWVKPVDASPRIHGSLQVTTPGDGRFAVSFRALELE